MESLTPLQEAAVFVSSVWQGEFYVDWPTGVLIFSIILYMVLGVLTALWAAMIYCHMRSGRRSTKSTPLLYLFIISCIGCIARMVWAAVSIALDYESSYWAHEIPKRIAQISIAWSMTIVVIWYSLVAQNIHRGINGSESHRRVVFWQGLRWVLWLNCLVQLCINIAVAVLRNSESPGFEYLLILQVIVNLLVIMVFTVLGAHIWSMTRRHKFIFPALVNLLLVQIGISLVYVTIAIVATVIWLVTYFRLTMGLAIVIVGAETAMCFSMLLVVARVGHSSWSDFFSPLLHVAGQHVPSVRRGTHLFSASESGEDPLQSSYGSDWDTSSVTGKSSVGRTQADVLAAMFNEQPSLPKVLANPRYHAVKGAFAEYCKQQFCEENLNFWSDAASFLASYSVKEERSLSSPGAPIEQFDLNESAIQMSTVWGTEWQDDCLKTAGKLIHEYISPESPNEINIDSKTRHDILAAYEAQDPRAVLSTIAVAQAKIMMLLSQDAYARFLHEQDAIYSGITDT